MSVSEVRIQLNGELEIGNSRRLPLFSLLLSALRISLQCVQGRGGGLFQRDTKPLYGIARLAKFLTQMACRLGEGAQYLVRQDIQKGRLLQLDRQGLL